MKKSTICLFVLSLLFASTFGTGGKVFGATDFGTNLTYAIDGTTLTISVKAGKTEGTMPYWTISNYTNATTGRPWESSKTAITTVIINKGVKNIGSYAFNGCTSLATVKFGTSTTDTCSIDSIGTAAFTACSAVANVYCWESNGTRALAHWLSIGMANTTSNPFCASTAATKRFYMQSSNTTTISIPSGTTKVKQYTFYKTPATTIKFPSSVKYIGTYAVANSTSLASVYFGTGSTDVCGVDTIMGYVFTGCSAIANVYCYGGIGKYLAIGMNSSSSSPFYASTAATKKFYLDGTSTTTLTIPEGITDIKKHAFYKHSYLTKVSLPSTITSVGAYAFAYCTGLTDFVALPATPPSTTNYTFNNTTIASINLYVASATAVTAYSAADRWKDFATRSATFEGECGASGDNITFVLNFGEHSLTLTGSGAMATYSTSTKAPWYTFKDDIQTISIGSGITGIGAYAFKDCSNVTSASLPASITSIGSSAFDGCKAMTSYSYAGTIAQWLGITFSGSSSNPMYYVKKCFVNGSTEVNNLVIPNGTTAIGNYAFYQCSGLTSVTLPASLTSAGTAAFSTCTNIANTNFLGTIDQWCGITFAANIANPAFFSKQLSINGVEQTDIYLADDLTEVKDYVFEDNRALERVSIKNTTTINSKAFKDCSADIVVRGELSADFGTGLHWSLWDGVLTISKVSGTGAMPDYTSSTTAPWYPYRKSISKIVIEEGVTLIGKYSFQSFTGNTGVYLPSTLATINDYAFYQATGISYIVSKATTPPTIIDSQTGYSGGPIYDSNAFTGIPTTILVYVPSGSESSYSTAVTSSHSKDSGWKRFTNYIPTIVFTGNCGTSGHESEVTWIYDPADKSMTISGSGAMNDYNNATAAPWSALKSVIAAVVIESGVTKGGKYTFANCTALTDISLAASCSSFGSYTFTGCTSLTEVALPEGITVTGGWMFSGCTNLANVTLPSTLTEIDVRTFDATAISSIEIPEGVTEIDNFAFYNCASLASINLPSALTRIGTNAFNGCTNLASVTSQATNPPTIQSSTFSDASSKTLYLPHSVTVKTDYRAANYWSSFTEANTFPKIVQFDLNGKTGDAIDPQYFDDLTSKASAPSDPAAAPFTFNGWYENAEGTGSAFDFASTDITADKTLYAKWTFGALVLNETADNSTSIAAYDGLTTDVTMTRSFTNAQYNTIVLPFSLSASQMATTFGADYDLQEFTGATYYSGEQILDLAFTQRTAMEAGKPYLLQPANNVSNPSFTNVEIDASEPSDGLDNSYIEFHGVYSPTLLQGGNQNLLFLGAENTLYFPNADGYLKGFRAYFEVKNLSGAPIRLARIVHHEDAVTSVDIVESQKSKVESVKVIRDGQLLILRDGKTYNAQGILVK